MKTNFEEHKEEILRCRGKIQLDKYIGVVSECETECDDCAFYHERISCDTMIKEWFCEEYKHEMRMEHKLYQHEVDVLKAFAWNYGTPIVKKAISELRKKGWFNGIVDFDGKNFDINGVLRNYELVV